MVRINFFLFFSLFCVFLLNSAFSEVVERDWKTPGDGLLTYDTVNKREWLDIPVSLLSQFHPTNADLATDIALAELAPGGLFEGFTFATREDVVGLVNSATPLTLDFPGFYYGAAFPMSELVKLLGSLHSSEDVIVTSGVINEITNPPSRWLDKYYLLRLYVSAASVDLPNNQGSLSFGNNDDLYYPPFLGMMLYRNAIPEPSGGFLIIVATGFAMRLRLCHGRRKGVRTIILTRRARLSRMWPYHGRFALLTSDSFITSSWKQSPASLS